MSQAVIAQPQRHTEARYELTELAQLALEIHAAEDLDIDTALAVAADHLDQFLRYYPEAWDGSAANAGNWQACADAIPF